MRAAGLYLNVVVFHNKTEGRRWLSDADVYSNLVATVNQQHAGTPEHGEKFVSVILPAFNLFVQRWGIAKVPRDIRETILDGYTFFGLEDAPIFPPAIAVRE